MKSFDEPKMHAYAEAYFRHVPSASAASATDAAVEAQRFMDALKRNTHLNALAGTPLLLSLICYLYRLEGLPLPAGQSQLYDRATLHLLQTNLSRAARVYPDVLKRRILEMIAFEVTVRHHHHRQGARFRSRWPAKETRIALGNGVQGRAGQAAPVWCLG